MTYSTQISTKKLSFVLSLFVVCFTIVGSYLFVNYQINLMEYATPVILILVTSILTCGLLNKLFNRLLTENGIYFSFPKQESSPIKVEEVPVDNNSSSIKCTDSEDASKQQADTTTPISITINLENTSDIKSRTDEQKPYSVLDKYEAQLEEKEKQNRERRIEIMNAVRDYTVHVMSEFLSKENLATLLENINNLACGQLESLKPIRSNTDNPLLSPDLRHFAWNVGQRLNIKMSDRALFIKTIFPYELREATVQYLEKNMRDKVAAKIPNDVPQKGDYRFKYMTEIAA